MSFESRLDSESAKWQHDGLITEETRRAILARYPQEPTDPSRVLIPLAVLTAGFGVVLLVAWNWEHLTPVMKLGLTSLLTLALYAGSAWSAGRDTAAYTEAWLLGATLGSFTLFAALDDVFLWGDVVAVSLCCAAAAAITAAVTGATLVTALAACTTFWWLLVSGGSTIPWQFPLVFVLIALGAEQSRHRVVAVLVALCFATWSMIMAANIWTTTMPTALMVAAAGAALEQWSRRPAQHRLVFARATPARAVMIGGLVFALLAVVSVGASDRGAGASLFVTHAAQSPWPSLALAACLVLMGIGGIRSAVSRPGIVAFVVALWFMAAGLGRVQAFGAWPWIAGFSALLLFIGASLVREAAQTRDVGTFTLGLASVIGLVVVHFATGRGLRGAIVLLVCALVLFLVGRRSRLAVGGAQ